MFSKLSLAFILVVSMQLAASVSTREFVEVEPDSSRSITCVLREREAIVSLAKNIIGQTRACASSDARSANIDELVEEILKKYQACSILRNSAEFCVNKLTDQLMERRDIGAIAGCALEALRENIRDIISLAIRLVPCIIF